MATTYELAKRYYPRLWDKSRIDQLFEAGKLTQEEYDSIINSSQIVLERR